MKRKKNPNKLVVSILLYKFILCTQLNDENLKKNRLQKKLKNNPLKLRHRWEKIIFAIEKFLFVDLNFSMMRTIAPEQEKKVDFSIINRHITSTHQPVRLHTRKRFEFKNKFIILYRNESRLSETTFSKWTSWEIICSWSFLKAHLARSELWR